VEKKPGKEAEEPGDLKGRAGQVALRDLKDREPETVEKRFLELKPSGEEYPGEENG
jgi:hypothetical protein